LLNNFQEYEKSLTTYHAIGNKVYSKYHKKSLYVSEFAVSENFTGLIVNENRKYFFKDGKYHNPYGYSFQSFSRQRYWHLDGINLESEIQFENVCNLSVLKMLIVLNIEPHHKYPMVKIYDLLTETCTLKFHWFQDMGEIPNLIDTK